MSSSVILQTATRLLMTLLLLESVFLLLRGHNEPGGGFIGGLVAASAFVLCALAYDVPTARRALRVDPQRLIGAGLLAAATSAAASLVRGEPFLTGQWGTVRVPGLLRIDVGTPLLFDVGVYLVVIGVTLLIVLTLAEE